MRISKLVISWIIATITCLQAFADLHPVSNSKGKWGYEDDNGDMVIKCSFNGASEFVDGKALVQNGNKYGLIDTNGKFILKPQFDMIGEFNALGLAEVIQGEKHGFVNSKGEMVIPCKFRYVGAYNRNGLVWVNEGGSIKKGSNGVTGGKFIFFRSDGTPFFDKPYTVIGHFIPWVSYVSSEQLEKMTVVEQQLTKGESHKFWRKEMINFIPGTSIPDDSHAYYVSTNSDSNWNGVYSSEGKMIIPAGKYYFANCPENGICNVMPKMGTGNFLEVSTGRFLLSSNIDQTWGYHDGYAIGIQSGLSYIYDTNGNKCSDGYTAIYPANSGMHVVRNGQDKYGLISTSGKKILSPKYYAVYPSLEGLSLVKETSSSKVGYVDASGEWVIKPEYSSGHPFLNGKTMVKKGGKWGMIDRDNNIVMPFDYHTLFLISSNANPDLVWGAREENGNFECFDLKSGSVMIPAAYSSAWGFDRHFKGMAMVQKDKADDKWGWIDMQGNEVVPCTFTAGMALKAGREYENSGRSRWDDYKSLIFNLHNTIVPVDLRSVAEDSLWDY